MKIKICGITNYEDAKVALDNGADALGFILYQNSKRFIEYNDLTEILKKLPFFVMKVGVFVNEYYTKVNVLASQIGLNAVQIHGDESPFYCDKITHPSIKAFRIHDKFDFSLLDNYNDCTYLLDSKSNHEYGGTGTIFDWKLIPKKVMNNVIIAGGVSITNIEEIKEKINPQAVDVASSVEDYPGKKDHNKLKEFLKMAKGL